MKNLLCFYLFFIAFTAIAQDEALTAFYNPDTLIGFKDNHGNIKIAPRFGGFTSARRLDKIAAVMDMRGNNYDIFYLVKDGREVARDSVYIFDFTFDCESEGHIRFAAPNGNIGLLNGNGKVSVPAEYNALSRVTNGVAAGLKNAEKDYWDKHDHDGCNHYSWKGGTWYLINTQNEVLVENASAASDLDFTTMALTDAPSTDPTRVNFKSINGKYYSFVDNKKLLKEFLKELKAHPEYLLTCALPDIYHSKRRTTGIAVSAADYLRKNIHKIAAALKALPDNVDEYTSFESWLPVPDEVVERYNRYLDNCGNLETMQHPVAWVAVPQVKKKEYLYIADFYFIKDNGSFKLISLSLN